MSLGFLGSWYQSEQNHDPTPKTCCFHPLPQAHRCGNSPCHNSQQHPAPSPLGRAVLAHLRFKVGIGLFETSEAPLRYSKGDICPLPNRMMQDVQQDKAHPRPALVVPNLLWLRKEERTKYFTMSILQALQ